MIGWYDQPTNLISSSVNLKVLLDKFETMFDSIAFSESESLQSDCETEESLWMGRVAGFVCNFVRIDDHLLAVRLLKILQTKYSTEWIQAMLVHRPF